MPPRTKDTIFTNVVHNLEDNTVWWEGLDKNPPKHALNWKGEPWDGSDGDQRRAPQLPVHRSYAQLPLPSPPSLTTRKGVPVSAIIFGGRRAKTAPLVYQSFDWDHGVFVGSVMGS